MDLPLKDPARMRELCEAALRGHRAAETDFSPATFVFLEAVLEALPGVVEERAALREVVDATAAWRQAVDKQIARKAAVATAIEPPSELISLAEMEHRYVLHVLASVGGNKSRAARILEIDRRSLYRRLSSSDQVRRLEVAVANT